MKMTTSAVFLFCAIIMACNPDTNTKTNLKKSGQQLSALRTLSMKENNIPRSTNEQGGIRWADPVFDWTEGFWPGTCWMLYEITSDEEWKKAAISSQKLFESHKT